MSDIMLGMKACADDMDPQHEPRRKGPRALTNEPERGRLPDFLIVGAAKSGTTSLYRYLSDHPDIFMPPECKEPRYFVSERFRTFRAECNRYEAQVRARTVYDIDAYRALFQNAGSTKAAGEASVAYLYYHDTAIANIKRVAGDIKIIIILRDPVARAYSHYAHAQRDMKEPLSFEAAIEREAARTAEGFLPLYRYVGQGMYYAQVKAYREHFSDVHVLLFEDLVERPHQSVRDLYAFLGVDASYVPSNIGTKYNESGFPKSRFLQRLVYGEGRILTWMKRSVRRIVPRDRLANLKRVNLRRVPMRPETGAMLRSRFRNDLEKLQALLQRDLSAWIDPAAVRAEGNA